MGTAYKCTQNMKYEICLMESVFSRIVVNKHVGGIYETNKITSQKEQYENCGFVESFRDRAVE